MAETPSTMLELGTPLPHFRLPDISGRTITNRDVSDNLALVVAFICPHCPYVKHIRPAFVLFANDYQPRGVAVIAINSNDSEAFSDDDVQGMKREASSAGFTFPYLVDESQQVARSFRAACTPDLFLFDRNQRLVYRGQFDDSRPNSGKPVTGADLRAAVEAVLAGTAVPTLQRPSVGCNIKWKAGRTPDYAGSRA
jgi:peroxiredoxin